MCRQRTQFMQNANEIVILARNKDHSEDLGMRKVEESAKTRALKINKKKTKYMEMDVALEIWERNLLRKIYGRKKEGYMWIRRATIELIELYDHPTITEMVRAQMLRRLVHAARLSESRLTKRALKEGITGG
ncbi:hypothetical protein HHI36_012734 [Cryptolaemus montrouzieri]|uniref:Uncharacterized protein n=1 Tax=Cryptolaemus montrouzieri TaxID=559131 RepID=A0ABD2NG68_9CUCU